jgi:hypothetical protein
VANRVEAGPILGQGAVGGRAKRYVDPDPFKGNATEVARRLGVSRRTVFNSRVNHPAAAPDSSRALQDGAGIRFS